MDGEPPCTHFFLSCKHLWVEILDLPGLSLSQASMSILSFEAADGMSVL